MFYIYKQVDFLLPISITPERVIYWFLNSGHLSFERKIRWKMYYTFMLLYEKL